MSYLPFSIDVDAFTSCSNVKMATTIFASHCSAVHFVELLNYLYKYYNQHRTESFQMKHHGQMSWNEEPGLWHGLQGKKFQLILHSTIYLIDVSGMNEDGWWWLHSALLTGQFKGLGTKCQ